MSQILTNFITSTHFDFENSNIASEIVERSTLNADALKSERYENYAGIKTTHC